MENVPSGNVLTRKEAAERLGVSERHVDRLLDQGKLTGHRVGAGVRPSVRIDERSVDARIAALAAVTPIGAVA